ncbi:glycosyltransferase [Patescibacteria group bacterium]|nr:glycosyltransferase [Patescibacteria group bacterium]
MRIGIDARFYGPESKGIGRYSQKLITHLEKFDQENEYFIFLRQENFDLYHPSNQKFHKVLADYPWYSLKEQIFFPFKLAQLNLDLVHFLHFNVPLGYRGTFIVTIHDLIHGQLSRKASTLSFLVFYFKKLVYFLVINRAIKKAQKVITVSLFSKKMIIKKYKINPEKVIVIYEAA